MAGGLPYSGGLKRNIVQCLEDFDIPLYLLHHRGGYPWPGAAGGRDIAQVDENRRPIPGTQRRIPCDTLLLSVGLLPENELSCAAGCSSAASPAGRR